jgi:hypothetical protein
MDYLKRVRAVCLALPETWEKEAWGAPTFRVKKKMFAMFADHHHNDGRTALWCHAAPDSQELLVKKDPQRFFVPPYVGPSGWIGIDLKKIKIADLKDRVFEAYCMVAPEKLVDSIR